MIVTIGLEELLAKAGLAETSDGSQLSADQLLRIADEAEIWPTIINHHSVPLALGQQPTAGHARPNHGAHHTRWRMFVPGLHSSPQLVRPTPHSGLDPRRAY